MVWFGYVKGAVFDCVRAGWFRSCHGAAQRSHDSSLKETAEGQSAVPAMLGARGGESRLLANLGLLQIPLEFWEAWLGSMYLFMTPAMWKRRVSEYTWGH